MAKSNLLKIGDNVMWRGAFGTEPPVEATVEGLEWCKVGEKEGGRELKSINWDKVDSRQLIVSLTNGHWARGTQISKKI